MMHVRKYSALRKSIPFAILSFVLFGCALQPIHNSGDVQYSYYSDKNLTVEEIQKVVERTAKQKGWELSGERPGFFIGKRTWSGGKHSISVNVFYDQKAFSIKYLDSHQMRYDGSWIHNSYNRMVEELEKGIKGSVETLYMSGT